MTLSDRALRGIAAYRHSRLHERTAGCCRFTPSCSHYAEEALARRSFPVAVVLVAWRLLRCNPLTPRGTVDHVGPRSRRRVVRVVGVLALSALTTFFVASTASAAVAPSLHSGGSTTAGGCDAFVAGVPIGNLDVDHPLQVYKNQRVVLTGVAPLSVRNLPSTVSIRSKTDVEIQFIAKLVSTTLHETSTGQRFQRSVNVDTYLKYGSGVYRVVVHSAASPAWDCSATFYVELHGSKLAADAAILLGCVGAVGVVASAGNDPPEKLPTPDEGGTYNPEIAPDTLDRAQARDRAVAAEQEKFLNWATSSGWGCIAAALYVLLVLGLDFGAAALPLLATGGTGRVWVKGRPVLGFFGGLLAGIGATIALQQYGFFPLTVTSAVIAPLVLAVLGALRGWRGKAWKVTAS